MLERQGKVAADEICDVGMEPVVEGSGFFYLFRQKKVTWHDILLMMIGAPGCALTSKQDAMAVRYFTPETAKPVMAMEITQ